VNKGRVGKKAFDGAKELEDALNDFSIGNKKNNHRGEKNKSTFAAGAPSSLPDLATAQGQGQDFLSLSAQVQALLAHTALLEARINQKDGQIASLTAAVASLCQTAPIQQQQQQQQQQNNGNGNGRGNDSAVPGLSQRELQLEEFVNKLDHNIAACGANLNQHSKVISEIKAELNAANQNAVQLSTHFLGFKEALRNLDHLYITQASALARFEAEVADVKNYFKEHQTEIKKKVEAAVKVAEGARTSWDSLSPRAAPATNMF
jgi:chromosome segregation ATPase